MNSLSFSSFSMSEMRFQIKARAMLAIFFPSYLIRDLSLLGFPLSLVVLFFETFPWVFFWQSFALCPIIIKASIFFHVSFSFFNGHFVDVHCIQILSCVRIPWCKGSLCLIGVGVGCSSASSKDFLYPSVLCIILRCLFVPFVNPFWNGWL